MKYISLILIACLYALAGTAKTPDISGIVKALKLDLANDSVHGDTVISKGGYNIKVLANDSAIVHVGLNLFPEDIKKSLDKEYLDFIETALLAKSLDIKYPNAEKLTFLSGSIADMKSVTPETPFTFNNYNTREMIVDWDNNGNVISVSMPIGYDVISDKTRGEIEKALIDKIKAGKAERRPFPEFNPKYLEAYLDSAYVLPGPTYLNDQISRTVYFDMEQKPVWNSEMLKESVTDLMLLPGGEYGNPMIDVTVMKHEFGDKDQFEVPVEQLIAALEEDGCVPFFGIEECSEHKLLGALFLYNRTRGYNHVLRVEGNPEEIVEGAGKLNGRLSLYVPVNNIYDLYAPYENVPPKEGFNYEVKGLKQTESSQ